ncbi:histidine kinase [Pseudonocardia sp. C8]|uniref:sensor histidine kinase n=1 Tax=Pseudonocardia sp. C8 TaxID=2762759 RepID=UPI001C92BE13
MTGWLRRALSARTYRRVLHVLLGAVVVLPYLAAGWVLALTAAAGAGTGAMIVLTVPVVLIGAGVTVLPGVRELLGAAARTLLDADLPDEPASVRVPLAARLRAAGWLLLCAALGAAAAVVVLFVVPIAIAMVLAPWQPYPPLPTGASAWWAPPLGLLLVPALLVALAGAGTVQGRLAPWFLGPDAEQRRAAGLAAELADARRRADRQAERARLARELHDSVGHALTVTTLQAGAAAELLGTDPAFARRALETIAETGRAALDDLDHVLGVLREDDDTRSPEPVRDLESLDALVAGARAAGLELRAEWDPAAGVPAAVSREAYRLVQEGLTNALKHAGPGPAELCLRRTADGLELRIVNAAGAAVRRRGRGLAGSGERVALLGGTLRAGPDGDRWVLHATLPAGNPPGSPATARRDDDRGPAR